MTKPKKIMILSLAYYPEFIGGAEVAIKEITDRISPDEIFFEMITLRFSAHLLKKEKIGNVTIHRVGFVKGSPSQSDLVRFPFYLNKVLFPVFASLKFFSLNLKNRYDGIWAMMSYMGMVAVLIRTFISKIPFVMSIQEGDDLKQVTGRFRIKLFLPILKKAFRDAVAVSGLSNYLVDWAKGMGARRIDIIPNGVNFSRFKSSDFRSKSEEIRNKYGIKGDEKLIITTSRLVQKNGVDILIKSMKFLPEEVKLLIVGNGPLESDLKLQATNYQLQARVIFCGFVPQDKIPEYLFASDVFCRPSRTEGQGVSFLEAMAAGLPVVATAVGGIQDFIFDKVTGLLAKVDDPEDVARKILILLRDNVIKDEIVLNAQKLVVEKYDWNQINRLMKEKIFERIS
jgi:glycosyltransferase involved in cell wall biosynthesis